MLIGIIAVIFAVLNGQGGIATGDRKSLAYSLKESAMAGPFTSMFGPMRSTCLALSFSLRSARGHSRRWSSSRYHQDRSSHRAGRHHLDDLRARGCGWLVFLGWFRPLVWWRYRRRRESGTPILIHSIAPTMLAALPDILLGIVVVLVLSVSMSTLAVLAPSSSSMLHLARLDQGQHREEDE